MPSNAAAAKGSVDWAQKAGNVIGSYAGSVAPFGVPELTDFSKWLDQLTSTDPTARMTAAGPQIADITANSEAAKQSIKNLPRGGEQNYLLANADISKASDISKLLTSEFSAAEQAKMGLGEWGVGTVLSGTALAANTELAAGALAEGLAKGDAAATAAVMNSIASLASIAYKAYKGAPVTPTGTPSTFPANSPASTSSSSTPADPTVAPDIQAALEATGAVATIPTIAAATTSTALPAATVATNLITDPAAIDSLLAGIGGVSATGTAAATTGAETVAGAAAADSSLGPTTVLGSTGVTVSGVASTLLSSLGPAAAAFVGFNAIMNILTGSWASEVLKYDAKMQQWAATDPKGFTLYAAQQEIKPLQQQLASGVIPQGERASVQAQIARIQKTIDALKNSGN